jgi:hypothetical protein
MPDASYSKKYLKHENKNFYTGAGVHHAGQF